MGKRGVCCLMKRNKSWPVFIKGEKGQALVELAVVLLVLLVLFMGIIEVGRIGHAYLTVLAASREAARTGILGKSDLEIANSARQAAAGLEADELKIEISPPKAQRERGSPLSVRVTYPLDFIVPLSQSIFGKTLIIAGETVMRME